jgi:hypothetical protein
MDNFVNHGFASYDDEPEEPPHNDVETSVAMAEKAAPHFRERKRLISELLERVGLMGRTCYEIEDELGITHQSASGALRPMEVKGLVWVPRLDAIGHMAFPVSIDDPRPRMKRPNQFGNPVQVYVHRRFGGSS